MKVQTVSIREVYLSGVEFFSLAMALKGYPVEVTAFEAFTNRHSFLSMEVHKMVRNQQSGYFEVEGTLGDGREDFRGIYNSGTKHFPCTLTE